MTLDQLVDWVRGVPGSLPEDMRPMAESICEAFQSTAKRLMDLGLGYLTLDRAASTLSTGERQRMQLARAVRNCTTGVLYVLDEPSIGLHPSNLVGLTGVMHDLVADGNSVILVDHDTQILKEADWIIEMGPEAGAKGGHVIAQGTIPAIEENPASQIGPFLSGKAEAKQRTCAAKESWMPPPSGSMSAPRWRLTQGFTTTCESYMQNPLMQRRRAIKRATFPITPARSAALAATERASSVWMYSSCRM